MRKILLLLLAISVVLFSLLYFNLPLNLLKPVIHRDTIDKYADEYGIDPLFIVSVIKVESNFIKHAKSRKGAIGLMQLMPATANDMAAENGMANVSEQDLQNPEVNIHFGTHYLAKLLKEFDGNEILALAAYNAGLAKTETWYKQNPVLGVDAKDIPYEETRQYIKSVMRTYNG